MSYSSTPSVPSFLSRQLSVNTGALDRSLYGRRAEIARLNEHLATGKLVNRASDDPSSFDIARGMDQTIGRYDQYLRTIGSARLWVDETESALNDIVDRLATAYEKGLRAANATATTDDREVIAVEIESLLEEIVSMLNTKAGGEYIFAGSRTTAPPFALDDSASADGSGVTYYGDGATRERRIGDDLTISINLTGEEVVTQGSGETITESIAGLIDAIRSGDASAMEAALGSASGARDHVLHLVTRSGSASQRMTFAEDHLRRTTINLEARRSRVEDADLTETVTELQKHQLGLQAATQALLAIRQLSLTNFL